MLTLEGEARINMFVRLSNEREVPYRSAAWRDFKQSNAFCNERSGAITVGRDDYFSQIVVLSVYRI